MCMVVLCRRPLIQRLRLLCSRQFDTGQIKHTAWIFSGPARPDRCSNPARWMRGVKTRAELRVQDLPQGAIADNIPIEVKEDGAPMYPTVVQQARNNMVKFEHCVLLTRVGGFYEVSRLPIEVPHYAHRVYIALLRTCRTVRANAQSEGGAKENRCRSCAYGNLRSLNVHYHSLIVC